MQPQRAIDLNSLKCSSSSATGAESYRAGSVIAPSGTDSVAARICEDGSIELNDLMRGPLSQLAQFRNLPVDWDDCGGVPISVFTLSKAIELFPDVVCEFYRDVKEGVRPYDVAPMGDGGVQLEWHGPSGILELEVHRVEGYGYLLIQGEGENRMFEEGEISTPSQVMNLLSRIFRPQAER